MSRMHRHLTDEANHDALKMQTTSDNFYILYYHLSHKTIKFITIMSAIPYPQQRSCLYM
jgi:hypothetical protein